MAENVRVIVRCRPMNKKEHDLNCKCIIKTNNCMIDIWDPNEGPTFPKQFTFDSTYDQNSHTESIYNDICYPLVESVLEGYNATIFVYGQTGCGKSYTMEGYKSNQEKGLISRAFEHVFEAISVTSGIKYLALVSYLEIYNEQIRDLLISTNDNNKITNNLNLKESSVDGVTVSGLTSHPVHNANECEHYLNLGSKNRIIGATLMNQNSSRSHSIFTISIEQISNIDNNETIKKGKLNLVDLAGSERQTKTGATGDRLKEATKINLSLSALGNVISALVDGKAKHIPYRDSKLTRLLQDSLGGNTRTLMIACVSPSSRDYVETLSTLRYANRAKNIHNKPRINEDPKDAILREYQEEIERLKCLLNHNTNSNTIKIDDLIEENQHINNKYNNNNINGTNLDERRDKLIKEYQEEMLKLKNLHENEKNEKETVIKQIELIKLEYENNIENLNKKINDDKKLIVEKNTCTKDEIINRIEQLKAALIGGEKVNDYELSERRKRKKLAAENRASVIAHLLAKIEMNEDRDLLQNQYKDISYELNLKTDILRRYRHKFKLLEKDINDIQSEFEIERQDYLETIRKQDQNIKLLTQINEKISQTLKKDCNYSDLEQIKDQAIWLEDSQKFKLPELIIPRTKLPPPPGRLLDIQTAPARLQYDESFEDDTDKGFLKKKLEKSEKDDVISSYFQPTTKRANELLNQSSRLDANRVFSTWRGTMNFTDFTKRNKTSNSTEILLRSPVRSNPNLNHSFNGLNSFWSNGASPVTSESNLRKPFRLEALPSLNINNNKDHSRNERLNSLEFL